MINPTSMHRYYWIVVILDFISSSVMRNHCEFVVERGGDGSADLIIGGIGRVHYESNFGSHLLLCADFSPLLFRVYLAVSRDKHDDIAEEMNTWRPLHFRKYS